MELKTEKQVNSIVSNLVQAAVHDIQKLSKPAYDFIHLASGFIAHYNHEGFISTYMTERLADAILRNQPNNQWANFHPGEKNYEYMMQKKEIYNRVCEGIRKEQAELPPDKTFLINYSVIIKAQTVKEAWTRAGISHSQGVLHEPSFTEIEPDIKNFDIHIVIPEKNG